MQKNWNGVFIVTIANLYSKAIINSIKKYFLIVLIAVNPLHITLFQSKTLAMGVIMTIAWTLWQAKADNKSSVIPTNLQKSSSESSETLDWWNSADIDPRYYSETNPFKIPKIENSNWSAPEYQIFVKTGATTYITLDGMDPGSAKWYDGIKPNKTENVIKYTNEDSGTWLVTYTINWVPKTIVVHLNASCEIITLPEPILKPGESPYKNVYRTARSTPITLNAKWNMAWYNRGGGIEWETDSTKVAYAGERYSVTTTDFWLNERSASTDIVYICAFPEVESASRTITLPITNIWVTYTLKSKATWELIGTILGNGQDQSFTSIPVGEYELFTQVGEDQPEACPSALIIKDVSGINEVSATGTLLHRLSGSTFGSTEEVAYKVYSAEGRVLAQGTGSVIYIKGDSNFVIIKYCRTNSNHQTYIQKFTVR